MNISAFTYGFYHPFGDHSGEKAKDILVRKSQEIHDNDGWTLWSFKHLAIVSEWHRLLSVAPCDPVYVFCSEGKGSTDPAKAGKSQKVLKVGRRYCPLGEKEYKPIPDKIRVPHSISPDKSLVLAFLVSRVLHPIDCSNRPNVEWLNTDGEWQKKRIFGRSEFLIRPGGNNPLHKYQAVLELKAPYLALVSLELV